jgi:hypothetical protein
MTNRPPEAKKDLEAAHTIAAAWRPVFTEIVRALVEGDYTLSGGVPRVRPVAPQTGDQMRKYVEQYGATLVELPKESWQTSVTQWMGGHWEVLVDLWTAEEGRSDLVLHSRVIETEDSFEIELCSIHVP